MVAWGVEQGVILAIVLSVIAHLRRSYSPNNAVLAAGEGHDWEPVPADAVPQAEPGLVVYRWGASLYFANSARFEEEVSALAEGDGSPVKWICVDAVAMGDVDYSGGETLIQVNNELKERGVRLVVRRCLAARCVAELDARRRDRGARRGRLLRLGLGRPEGVPRTR